MRLSPAPRGVHLNKLIINLVDTFFTRDLKGPKSLACVFFTLTPLIFICFSLWGTGLADLIKEARERRLDN